MLADLLRKLAALGRPTGLLTVRVDGRVWHLTDAGVTLLGPEGPRLERWLAEGRATVVKANPARTVYRVELPGGTVYVKHCRISGLRALGREIIRPPKARLEFDKALELRSRGVPAVEPLAWASTDSVWPGESVLITRGLPALPLLGYLEKELPALPPRRQRSARRQLAVALARFFACLHDAGVAHPDPHPGNLLVEAAPEGPPRLALLDVHDVSVGGPLDWPRSRDNLVLLNRWFQVCGERTDRVRFWRAYLRSRRYLPAADDPDMPVWRERARELERRTLRSNLHLWAGREPRWLGSGRAVRCVRAGRLRGLAVRDLPDAFLTDLLADPDAAFRRPCIRVLKDCPSATVAVVPMPTPAGPMPVVLKRVSIRSPLDLLRNLLRRSHVLRSWVNGHALRDRRLPTPRPLAVFHRYRYGLPAEGYLLTELVPNARPLASHVHAVRRRLARILRLMHDRGVSHRDLKAPNILLAGGDEPVLIDLVGVRTRTRLTFRRRAKELARLNVSFVGSPAVTRTDRLRFLRDYLAAGPELGSDWKTWWAVVSRLTAAKVDRNRRRGRVLG